MLETIGLDAEIARTASRWAGCTDASVGRVEHVHHGWVSVLTEDGPRRASVGGPLLGRIAHDPDDAPCAGDWCLLRDWPDHRVTVEHLLPRRTAVRRERSGGDGPGLLLCANADIVAVVVAWHPAPAPGRVGRLVALARESGAQPLLVLTGSHPVVGSDTVAAEVAAVTAGVETVSLDAGSGRGVEALRARLEGRLTLALIGDSGPDRSRLVDALVGTEVLASRSGGPDGRGSVRRQLVPLPGGGAVLDPARTLTTAARRGAGHAPPLSRTGRAGR